LGAVLVQPCLSSIVVQRLLPEYFFLDWHQRIYGYIREFANCRRQISLESLVGELAKRGVLEKLGGGGYISGLIDGVVPDRTTIEIWADPSVTRNCHSIEVDSDSAHFSFSIENIPSENPRTGRITALSVIAALRKLNAPLRVGT